MHPEDTEVFSAATVAQDGFLQNSGFMSLALSSPHLSYLTALAPLIVLLRKFSKTVISMQLLPFHHTLLFFFYHKKTGIGGCERDAYYD